MDNAFATAFVEVAYPVISSAALACARATGLVLVTPAFNRLGLTGMIRACVAVAISVPMFFPIYEGFTTLSQHGGIFIAGLLIKEMLIGVLVGLLFGIPFWAAEVAGELVDLQRGSTMAQLVDPLGANESGVMATLLVVTIVALFFMSGGFILMVDGYYHSYQLWPAMAFTPIFAEHALTAVLSILDQVMHVGVLMVAPLVIALLATDLMLAYLSRMASNFHIFDLSLPVKNLFFTLLMVVYIAFLIPVMLDQLGEFRATVEFLKTLAGGG
ncbi:MULTISPECIES: type III secretion system export apparatus subunit SctT [unclassified Pseudomonas]|uniref:type III secretion system export apparatus subunit SctT n=1 Tax=unclassified Pseudomonas TaxID=196821 RepID=UPI000BDD670D|nr:MULTISPECIES: type III secretion system export apparatus subunit SctT [unclassified Pseudomonas]PVZ12541.1 type III secretion protein T [Pseudomonas sp. URIL14HWK12:I12]PVZ23307.1 type III secretion protein T [Pseudomonas sp. URIL14HWK12:I10]PVZ32637.1 type III secretion protein T [Pseudomonas sp. URIL14HWK12:I11]SNZ13791.1 type III secretion protein T [Pseudomonas sp. URIL14HWK12:I9]